MTAVFDAPHDPASTLKPGDGNALLSAALQYAAKGWHVLPLHGWTNGACTCGAPPCPKTCATKDCGHCASPAKHPRLSHGFKGATTDPDQIRAWWHKWPDSNVGIATGPSGLFVVDIDPPKGGADSWHKLIEKNGRDGVESTMRQRTGSDGMHLLFRNDPEKPYGNSASRIGAGIDTRGAGGYIVAPPSVHRNGKAYAWVEGHGPEAQLQDPPTWLRRLYEGGAQGNGLVPREVLDAPGRIPVGRRDSTILSLAGSMRARGVDQAAIESACLDVARTRCVPPLTEVKALELARRYRKRDATEQNAMLLQGDESDDDNAQRLVSLYGTQFRYVPSLGFYVWDGARWLRDVEEAAMIRFATHTARALAEVAAGLPDQKRAASLAGWAIRSRNKQRLEAAVRLASTKEDVIVALDELDGHSDLLNVANGVLDLREGTVRPHDPNLYLTHLVDVAYRPDAKCPTWDRFLLEACKGDAKLAAFLQRCVGYTLTGHTSMHAIFFLYGSGRNGKSVFVDTVAELLGDLSTTMAFDAFLRNRSGKPSNDLVALVGKRQAIASEANEGASFNESMLKEISGGARRIRAEHKYKDSFDFEPHFKLWFTVNDKPRITGVDDGIWERLVVIPFRDYVDAARRDGELKTKLRAELEGILAWAVRGAMEWYRTRRLDPPPCVLEAGADYRSENNLFDAFVDEECTVKESLSCSAALLVQKYNEWADRMGYKEMTANALGRRLGAFRAGILRRAKNDVGQVVWRGIGYGKDAPTEPAGGLAAFGMSRFDQISLVRDIVHEWSRKSIDGAVKESVVLEYALQRGLTEAQARKCIEELLRTSIIMTGGEPGAYRMTRDGPAPSELGLPGSPTAADAFGAGAPA